MSALKRNPQVPAPTPHKVLGPGIDGIKHGMVTAVETPAFGEKFTTYNFHGEEAPCVTEGEELGPVRRQRKREWSRVFPVVSTGRTGARRVGKFEQV